MGSVKRLVHELTMFKVLVERSGILFSVTLENRALFFFVCSKLVGLRFAPTTDPDAGIVEICDYDILEVVDNWDRLSKVRMDKGQWLAQRSSPRSK